ncbi:unnamed protein product, partial [Polarella glacialis]
MALPVQLPMTIQYDGAVRLAPALNGSGVAVPCMSFSLNISIPLADMQDAVRLMQQSGAAKCDLVQRPVVQPPPPPERRSSTAPAPTSSQPYAAIRDVPLGAPPGIGAPPGLSLHQQLIASPQPPLSPPS